MIFHKKAKTGIFSLAILFLVVFSSLFSGIVSAGEAAPDQRDASIDIFLRLSNAINLYTKEQTGILKKMGQPLPYKPGEPPSVTLYLTRYPASAIAEIKRIVKDIANHQYRFPVVVEGKTVTESHWVFLGVKNSNDLQALSDRIALRLSPLHRWGMPEPSWVKLYPEKEAFVRKFGSPNVFAQFEPHLTLVANGKPEAIIKYGKIKPRTVEGHAIGIGIGYTNEYGQVTRTIATYPLRSKTGLREK